MNDTEKLALEYASQLCREYRAEISKLKLLLIVLSAALIIALVAVLKVMVSYVG